MKALFLTLAAAVLGGSILAGDLLITSAERNGTVTWTNAVSNAVYQLQWANSVAGPWTNFQSLAALDSITSTGSTLSAKVPMFYRVRATEKQAFRPDGLYRYTAYDTNGDLLVVGWWHVYTWTNVVGPVRGRWTNGYAGRPTTNYWEHVGPQLGTGELAGEIYPNRIAVGFNPNVADDTAAVSGELDDQNYAGNWIWERGFAYPPVIWGRFTLERIRSFSDLP